MYKRFAQLIQLVSGAGFKNNCKEVKLCNALNVVIRLGLFTYFDLIKINCNYLIGQ